MILSKIQALKTLTEPISESLLNDAKIQESRFRVYTEAMDEGEIKSEMYWNLFLQTLKTRSEKKFDRVLQFYRFPLPVVDITNSILNDYFKVFDGKNRYFNVESESNIETLTEWIRQVRPEKWIEENGKEIYKNQPSNILVIDKDQDGNPYLINLTSYRIIDTIENTKGRLEYISFIHSIVKDEITNIKTTFYGVYDDTTYRVYSKAENADAYIQVKEELHGLDYCPARFFVGGSLNSKNYYKRDISFSKSLANLEDWVIFDGYRNYMDHYAPFPITEAEMPDCDFDGCNGGFLEENDATAANGDKLRIENPRPCPKCNGYANGALIGPGTHIANSPPIGTEPAQGSNFQMHIPDVDKLKFIPEKLDDLELKVKLKTTGVNQILTTEAVNEDQVKGSFEDKENVLLRNKKELDYLYIWIAKTAGGLIYGPGVFIQVDANFGTEYYLTTVSDIQTDIEQSKKIGLPQHDQLTSYIKLIETKHKGNPSRIEKEKLLLQIDELALYSVTEANKMFEDGIIDAQQLVIKINFINLLQRFERENGPINEFGTLLEQNNRISIIQETLKGYTTDLVTRITNLQTQRQQQNARSTEN